LVQNDSVEASQSESVWVKPTCEALVAVLFGCTSQTPLITKEANTFFEVVITPTFSADRKLFDCFAASHKHSNCDILIMKMMQDCLVKQDRLIGQMNIKLAQDSCQSTYSTALNSRQSSTAFNSRQSSTALNSRQSTPSMNSMKSSPRRALSKEVPE
jgi:hypothetical protein